MSFLDAQKSCFRKYFDFSSRAARKEFWYFVLLLALIQIIVSQISAQQPESGFRLQLGFHVGVGPTYDWFTNIFSAIFVVPLFAVLSRRLHDIGKEASWIFVILFFVTAFVFIALKIGPSKHALNVLGAAAFLFTAIAFLYATLTKSQPGPNKYGPNPNEVPQ